MFVPKERKTTPSDIVRIVIGSVLAALSFCYLTYPNSIVSGGVTGISQIAHMLVNTPVGAMVITLNVPLFLLAWKKLGRRFVILSALCMVVNSVTVDIFMAIPFSVTDNHLLGAVYGGLLNGLGYGMVYTTGATSGGSDIPARFLRRAYPHIDFNIFLLGINGTVILAYAIIFRNFESCMYTLICMYIANKVEGYLLYGPVNSRLCYVISQRSPEIAREINVTMQRGVTLLDGRGSWSGQRESIILCAVKPSQMARLRCLVREIDREAFLIVTDARDVYGRGFENMDMED